MYGKRMNSIAVMVLAIMAALASAQEAGKDIPPQPAPEQQPDQCLTVELIMYSGRPRPKYLVCDEEEKKAVLKKMEEDSEALAADSSQPLESTSAYQGVLVTLPDGSTGTLKHHIVGRGKVKDLKAKQSRLDAGRRLERFFLDLGEYKEDESGPKGKTMRDVTGMARTRLDRD